MADDDKKPTNRKRPLLSQAVQAQQPAAIAQRSTDDGEKKRTSRVGTIMLGGHFNKPVQKQIKMLALEQDKTVQALLEEALNLLFKQYNKEPIA